MVSRKAVTFPGQCRDYFRETITNPPVRRCCDLHREMKHWERAPASSGPEGTDAPLTPQGPRHLRPLASQGLRTLDPFNDILNAFPKDPHVRPKALDSSYWKAQKQEPEDEHAKQIERSPQITLEKGFFFSYAGLKNIES